MCNNTKNKIKVFLYRAERWALRQEDKHETFTARLHSPFFPFHPFLSPPSPFSSFSFPFPSPICFPPLYPARQSGEWVRYKLPQRGGIKHETFIARMHSPFFPFPALPFPCIPFLFPFSASIRFPPLNPATQSGEWEHYKLPLRGSVEAPTANTLQLNRVY